MHSPGRWRSLKRLVVLGAGRGSRIGISPKTSKLRLRLHGQSLARRLLRRYFRAGVQEATVVLPGRWEALGQCLGGLAEGEAVSVVENTEPERGNGYSLLLALQGMEEGRVLVAMGDHFFRDPVVEEMADLLDASGNFLAVECHPMGASDRTRLGDATKVRLDDSDRIIAIGKGLRTSNGVDMGVFALDVDVRKTLRELVKKAGRATMTQLVRTYVRRRSPFLAKKFRDVAWFDIDTEEDLALVEQMLEA